MVLKDYTGNEALHLKPNCLKSGTCDAFQKADEIISQKSECGLLTLIYFIVGHPVPKWREGGGKRAPNRSRICSLHRIHIKCLKGKHLE
jgi:hypothetical protein